MTAPNHRLRCLDCSALQAPTVRELRCTECGGLFSVVYKDPPDGVMPRIPTTGRPGFNSLGEGNTPLVPLLRIGEQLGLEALWAKLEFMAPTGSFKDRGSAVLTSIAREFGVSEFVEDSSGNAGASLAAYSAAAGIKAHVFAPAHTPPGKLAQIEVCGAILHRIEGLRQAATDAALRYVAEQEMVYLSHNFSPYFSEGMKAASYEIVDFHGDQIEHVALPVGNGSLMLGMVRGYQELVEAGTVAKVPQFHAVQAHAVRPIVASLGAEEWSSEDARPTCASGIAVSQPPRLAEVVAAIRSTNGSGTAVDEDLIAAWRDHLATTEGLFVESTAAATFAGLEKLIESGRIPQGATVCIPITGSGLKEPLG